MQRLVHDLAARLRAPDNVEQYAMPDFEAEITNDPEINASAQGRKVLLNKALVQAFYNAPGELAFVIAHEVGHLQDADCHARMTKQNMGGALAQRECEAAADNIGMHYLIAAGFNAYDAAGAMGRLIMSSPTQNSIFAVIVGRFTSDHPVSMDRIQQLAKDARATCEERPEICK